MKLGRTLLVTLAVLAGAAVPAAACSCARPSASSVWENAAAVFTGVARGTRPLGNGRSVTTFEVTEDFKGADYGASVTVEHPTGPSASCGIQFALGATHTLSAYTREGALSSNLCSVAMFGDGKLLEELRQLRDGETENEDQ